MPRAAGTRQSGAPRVITMSSALRNFDAEKWNIYRWLKVSAQKEELTDAVLDQYCRTRRALVSADQYARAVIGVISAYAIDHGEKHNANGTVYGMAYDKKSSSTLLQIDKLPPKLMMMLVILARFNVALNIDDISSVPVDVSKIHKYKSTDWPLFNDLNAQCDIMELSTTQEQAVFKYPEEENQDIVSAIVCYYAKTYPEHWDSTKVGDNDEIFFGDLPPRLQRMLDLLSVHLVHT